jgi:putative ABC transport system permease protein
MSWIALRLLLGDRLKYFGLVFGIAFAALLIAQQSAVFSGVLLMTAGRVRDVREANVWVMSPRTQHVDDVQGLPASALARVRGVRGVAWAERLYKGMACVHSAGIAQQVTLLGVDEAGIGVPHELVAGRLIDLRRPGAILVDEIGHKHLWPGEPIRLGRTLEMNDHRAVLVGVCRAAPAFDSYPVLYARYGEALRFAGAERQPLSFVVARSLDDVTAEELCTRIQANTGLLALTPEALSRRTMLYYLCKTGIPLNFGITVLLGFAVGTVVAGQTLYAFTLDQLGTYASLKAMGLTNGRVIGVVLRQALVVGTLGYGLGVGAAALFGMATRGSGRLVYFLSWPILLGTGAAVLVVVALASVASIWRVLVLEPAVVIR